MSELPLEMRGYRSHDIEAMFRLDEACFAPQFRFSRAMMKRFAEAKNAQVVIGESVKTLAGFCIVHLDLRRNMRAGYVVTLDVAPELRRTGVAARLLQQAEWDAYHAGCRAMLLHVYTENDAEVRFYEEKGYTRLRLETGFYGHGVDALVYCKPLECSRAAS